MENTTSSKNYVDVAKTHDDGGLTGVTRSLSIVLPGRKGQILKMNPCLAL